MSDIEKFKLAVINTAKLEETIGMKGGRFTIAGVTFTSDDVENLKKEYLKL